MGQKRNRHNGKVWSNFQFCVCIFKFFLSGEQLVEMEKYGILHGTILITVDKKRVVLFGLSLVAV